MREYKIRLAVIAAALALCFFVVAGRLFSVQIIEGERYALKSKKQVQQRRMISAKRGGIYDRRGRPLAASVPGQVALDLNVLGVEGGGGQALLRRVYPMGDVAGPVLGYVGRDGYGLGGAEFTFDHYLRGEDGWEMVHRDGKQRTYRKIGLPGKDPRPGGDVYLTIDVNLQKIVQSVLKQTVESLGAKGAMCIVMDPHTGKILAMANEPSFNPNVASSFALADRQNRCISQVYEPGSTFKVMTAAVALQENMMAESDLIDGGGGVFEIYGEVIRDDAPQGKITFARALAVSSNVCFAQVASGFKNDQFYRYNRDFGFGARTGVALPGEEEGILHPVRSWSGRTRVTMAMGHEISATFLQMMLAYASVVNGGVLLSPVICERIERNGVAVDSASVKPVRRVISEQTAARLRRMMKDVVAGGTGRQAAVQDISVGGKTGTSRKAEAGGYSRTRHWSSFIGFLPVERPALLCGIVIDEPAGGKGGGAAAAPAFSKIMSQAIAHPELEFGDKILKSKAVAANDSMGRQIRLPDFAGRQRATVSRQLDSLKITYSFVGAGGSVRYQTPAAGTFMGGRASEVVLFTEEREFSADSAVRIVPDGVGKDLRDAFNMFNAAGIQVYAVGGGTVKRQSIAPGEVLRSAKACTLYCSQGVGRK